MAEMGIEPDPDADSESKIWRLIGTGAGTPPISGTGVDSGRS